MTKSIQIIGILALIPLFTMGLATTFVIPSVEAYTDPNASRNLDRDMQCRSGQVLVYHFNNRAYTCTSANGAALWAQHGIAEIVMKEGERVEPTTERVDRGEFAKRSEETMRQSEIEALIERSNSGERLSTGEQQMLARIYEKQLAELVGREAFSIDERRQPITSGAPGSLLSEVPKQLTLSQTITSVQDPAVGHEGHQIIIVLPPSEDVYIGRMSFSASMPIQYIMLMAPVSADDSRGQPVWSPDGGVTNYPMVIVDEGLKSGGYFFAGNALALHTMSPEPFTSTVSAVYTKVAPGEYPRGTVTAGTAHSIPDPGIGHEEHSIALILPPREIPYQGGVMAYAASEPIQLVALHGPLAPGEAQGQMTWTADGETIYALTLITDDDNMGVWNTFSGNALAVHTMNPDGFTVSYVTGGLH